MNTQMNGNGRSENSNSNGINTGSIKSSRGNSRMNDFFKDQLKDIYWAEKKLLLALPNMHNASTTEELKKAFLSHLNETKEQVGRLEKVFKMLGEKPETKKCFAMEGILTESENIINETHDDTAQRDIGLIFAAQKAGHYGIATYGALISLAKSSGKNEVADLLQKTLTEQKEADKLLTQIAEQNISYKTNREPVEA